MHIFVDQRHAQSLDAVVQIMLDRQVFEHAGNQASRGDPSYLIVIEKISENLIQNLLRWERHMALYAQCMQ
jgi:hypothetical protein